MTTVSLLIDTMEEIPITETLIENIQPTGKRKHYTNVMSGIHVSLIVTDATDINDCPMRENIQNCRIYLCRVIKNIMSIGFPCYSQ